MQETCANGHVFDKTSDCVCPKCGPGGVATSNLPKIGAPATRALDDADVKDLEDLTDWSERDLLALHGMGPKAVDVLREHLAAKGLAFKP